MMVKEMEQMDKNREFMNNLTYSEFYEFLSSKTQIVN